jgi:hypothetical protein
MSQIPEKVFLTGFTLAGAVTSSATWVLSCALRVVCSKNIQLIRHTGKIKRWFGLFIFGFILLFFKIT